MAEPPASTSGEHAAPAEPTHPDVPGADASTTDGPATDVSGADASVANASQPRTWLPTVLFALAALTEIGTLLLMTAYRYRSQNIAPEFFDITKTANLLGFLFELPFVLLFATLLWTRRPERTKLGVMAVAFSCTAFVLLVYAPLFQTAEQTPSYTGYLLFLTAKAMELASFIVAFGRAGALWKRTLRAFGWTVGIVVVVMAMVIASVLVSPFGSSITDQPRQEYDAGVILGAAVWRGDRPSPVLRERINRGFDLLKNGTVQFLVLTGGRAPNELPEAEVARRELLKRGADPTRIVTETRTSSTLEQVLFIRDQLQRKQSWRSFVIISDQFHLKRALEICEFNGISALGVSSESPLGPQNLAVYHVRESGALVLYWLFGT